MTLSEKFGSELALIQDEALRNFAVAALNAAPAYQLSIPASASGRNHPPDERGEGGQILHVKRVVRACTSWAVSFDLSAHTRDLLLVAALLHDIVKYGINNLPTERIWKQHDIDAHPFLYHRLHHMLPRSDWDGIFTAIEAHMGRWGNRPSHSGMGYPVTLGTLLHMADMIASEEWFTVDPLPEVTT